MSEIIGNWKILKSLKGGYWEALCLTCNITIRKKTKANMRGSKSCGCTNSYTKIGDKINLWTIVARTSVRGRWEAKCDCGNTRKCDTYELKQSYSCGCQANKRRESTCLERYGTKYAIQNKEVKDKQEKTVTKLYGVNNVSKSNSIKQKKKETTLKNYGVECYLGTLKQLERARQTSLEKYGTEYFFQSEQGILTKNARMINKYGVKHFSQLPENRSTLKEWCDENPHKLYVSKPELEILSWIQQYYPSAKKCKVQGNELDIFILELNLGIEHNGLYRHSELFKSNNYHLNKTNYFKQQGIRTIHILEHEWKYRREQVKSFLLSALGKNENKIGARICNLVWSSSKEEIQKAHQLLDTTHIQGHTNSTKYVANVYYNDELIATATFGKHHRDSKIWVLSRFTTKTNYTIQGILSKISRLASKKLETDIISWADYRLSQGNGYEKAEWKPEELLKPDYFYWKLSNVTRQSIISKQSRQKKLVNTPEGMTEHGHAKLDGLVRIYDCGKIRYRYKYERN